MIVRENPSQKNEIGKSADAPLFTVSSIKGKVVFCLMGLNFNGIRAFERGVRCSFSAGVQRQHSGLGRSWDAGRRRECAIKFRDPDFVSVSKRASRLRKEVHVCLFGALPFWQVRESIPGKLKWILPLILTDLPLVFWKSVAYYITQHFFLSRPVQVHNNVKLLFQRGPAARFGEQHLSFSCLVYFCLKL